MKFDSTKNIFLTDFIDARKTEMGKVLAAKLGRKRRLI